MRLVRQRIVVPRFPAVTRAHSMVSGLIEFWRMPRHQITGFGTCLFADGHTDSWCYPDTGNTMRTRGVPSCPFSSFVIFCSSSQRHPAPAQPLVHSTTSNRLHRPSFSIMRLSWHADRANVKDCHMTVIVFAGIGRHRYPPNSTPASGATVSEIESTRSNKTRLHKRHKNTLKPVKDYHDVSTIVARQGHHE